MMELKDAINDIWQNQSSISVDNVSAADSEIIKKCIELLNCGSLRVATNNSGESGDWTVNEWVKKAILLYFKTTKNKLMSSSGAVLTNEEHHESFCNWYDKVPLKFSNWNSEDFVSAGFRAVPGSFVREGSFVGKSCVLMPCFVNIGAYIDTSTMIDTWATVGSCAQIGKNCHISGGAGIGGVLEPLQAAPVIIEDDCFIGARSEIVEGVIVGKGSVVSMGVYIGKSTKIINRETGEIIYGKVPPYSVVVPGCTAPNEKGVGLYCAVIIKRVDEKTRQKTSINELLRD